MEGTVMTAPMYGLTEFVDDLRAITAETLDPRAIVVRVGPLARDLALARTWLVPRHYECDAEQGFGAHLLHEEPDHRLAVFAGAWLPGRGAPPHNHGTWAVVVGVDGAERNTFWTRLDDGSRPGQAEIRRERDQVLGPGEVVIFQPDAIHSVVNESARVTVSLHVYGKHVNYTTRSQFDPERDIEKAFILKVDG
jgi:predicted metal-dependent enzyme (double-stranded beta helix superfamily)